MKTKAAVLLEPGKPFELMELDLDAPGVGEVLIKYTAAGLCHSDLHLTDGDLPPRYPIVGGHEGSGIIQEVGPGWAKVKPGDHVVQLHSELRHLSVLFDRTAEPVRHGSDDPGGLHARRQLPIPRQRPGFRRHVHARHLLRVCDDLPAFSGQGGRLATFGDRCAGRLRCRRAGERRPRPETCEPATPPSSTGSAAWASTPSRVRWRPDASTSSSSTRWR